MGSQAKFGRFPAENHGSHHKCSLAIGLRVPWISPSLTRPARWLPKPFRSQGLTCSARLGSDMRVIRVVLWSIGGLPPRFLTRPFSDSLRAADAPDFARAACIQLRANTSVRSRFRLGLVWSRAAKLGTIFGPLIGS